MKNALIVSLLLLIAVDEIVIYGLRKDITRLEADAPWCVNDVRADEDVVPEFTARETLVVVNYGNDPNDGYYGKASWHFDDETRISLCEVMIPIPKKVWGDIDMETVGHEFLHCIIGDFHEE